MAFEQSEVTAFVAGLPQGALCGADAKGAEEWCNFLLEVDPSPKSRHDLFWYLSVGRLLAESLVTTSPLDLADPSMRDMISTLIKHGEKPYDKEGESSIFQGWAVQPSQVAFALRVQGKCAKLQPSQPTAESTLASTMTAYLEAQAASEKVKLSVKALSFKLSARVAELGLENFPEDGLPSEENLAVFEAAGRIAKDKGRPYVGSADGEDLQKNFRPAWSKVPRIEMPVGEGSVADRHRQMADFKRSRGGADLDFPGYASFQSHLLDWGMKLVLMKVATPVDILGYTLLLCKMAEECGGVRTAYQYDVLNRKAMAKALEKGDDKWKKLFSTVDRDMVGKAKDMVTGRASAAAAAAKASSGKGSSGNQGASSSNGGKAAGKVQKPARKVTSPVRSRSPRKDQWNNKDWTYNKGWSKK